MVSNLKRYTQEIRDLINKPVKQFNLLKNHNLWNQLCTSLDVIEDSELAIETYINAEFGKSDGEKYLKLYAVLQALFLQQDAVANLCEALKIPNNLTSYIKLKEIRDIRNDSIGHPTKRGNYKSYHFISRSTITKSGFQLISCYKDGKTVVRDISVIDLINEQRKYLSEILKSVINTLKTEEKTYKEKFKMEKLEDSLSNNILYYFEKIFESIGRRGEYAKLAVVYVRLVKKGIKKLEDSLHKKGIEIGTYPSIAHLYELLEYPIAELELYFNSLKARKEPKINDKTAYIFVYFIKEHLLKLKEVIREIDNEYSI